MNEIFFKNLFIAYFIIINLLAITLTVIDKSKAQNQRWRIKESTLFITAALGGSVSMYITMRCIRHKTKKKRFMLGIPAIILLQVLIVVCCFYKTSI